MAGSRNDFEAMAAGNPSDSAAELSTRIDTVIGALSGVCDEGSVSGTGDATLPPAPPVLSESTGFVALSATGKGPSPVEPVMAWEDSTGVVSLSEPRQDGTFCLEDVLGADNIASLVENVSLRQAVSRLPKDEKELIYYRYYKNYPQTQVAELLGVTQVKVSRTEKKIMEKLRRELG